MKKSGFTLIELLGTIVILGIVGLIVVPVVDNSLKKSKQTLYNNQINHIKKSAETWVVDHIKYLPSANNESITITLQQLKNAGYVDQAIKNPKTDNELSNSSSIVITKNGEKYIYDINIFDKTKEEDVVNPVAPVITLKGSNSINMELDYDYIDSGAIAKKSTGETIYTITKTITKNGSVISSIPKNAIATYKITYTATDNDLSSSIIRTITYKDTLPPVLLIPEDSVINSSVSSFNLLIGVSATDNSKQNVDIKVEGNLALGIPGIYKITYTATDIYGNQASKIRKITIVGE